MAKAKGKIKGRQIENENILKENVLNMSGRLAERYTRGKKNVKNKKKKNTGRK